jgi:hypothetical protein
MKYTDFLQEMQMGRMGKLGSAKSQIYMIEEDTLPAFEDL